MHFRTPVVRPFGPCAGFFWGVSPIGSRYFSQSRSRSCARPARLISRFILRLGSKFMRHLSNASAAPLASQHLSDTKTAAQLSINEQQPKQNTESEIESTSQYLSIRGIKLSGLDLLFHLVVLLANDRPTTISGFKHLLAR